MHPRLTSHPSDISDPYPKIHIANTDLLIEYSCNRDFYLFR